MLGLTILSAAQAYADVGDNLNGWLINFLGYGKESSVPDDYGGSLVERVNYLEKNMATKEDVENVAKAVNASYNLYVYIPKDEATGNYDGQKVTITSSSGNQNSSAILRDDGKNYAATLSFNFSGDCKINFNMIYNSVIDRVQLPITISATGQEQKLWEKGKFSECYSWAFIHEICSNNKANQFFNTGTKLKNGWSIVNVSEGEIKILGTTNIGYMSWSAASSAASSYVTTWNSSNSELPVVALKSELLSKVEAETISTSSRLRTFNYWSATQCGNEHHWFICSDGSIREDSDRVNLGCLPAVWIK